jgi:hypothetical protein
VSAREVREALFAQFTKKAPGVDGISFKALRMLWRWAEDRVVSLVQGCIRTGYHPCTSGVIGLDPYWIGCYWIGFGWIGSVLLHYWMDWIDARKSNWIQLPKRDSRYLVGVHHESGALAPRTRMHFVFAGVSATRDTRASCFPSHIC